MMTFRRVLAIAVLVASVAGLQSTSSAAAPTLAPVHSVAGCCWIYQAGRWYCVPC